MTTKISEVARQQLADDGVAVTGDIGGLVRKRYYTPDGREIFAIPAMRSFVRKDASGKVIETGIRDANYDKGWLENKPAVLQLYCRFCDKWHDTQKGIKACQVKKKQFEEKWAKKTKQEVSQDNDAEIQTLKSDMAEIKALLNKLLTKGG